MFEFLSLSILPRTYSVVSDQCVFIMLVFVALVADSQKAIVK